jgi:hypothetical protein
MAINGYRTGFFNAPELAFMLFAQYQSPVVSGSRLKPQALFPDAICQRPDNANGSETGGARRDIIR